MIVVDTNIITYFSIRGVFSDLARQAARQDDWCAPILWRSEFRNVLATYIRHQSMPEHEARTLMNLAERRMWGREFTVRSSAVLDLVLNSKRSAYDCEFVALAQDLRLKLVSTDDAIISEFPKIATHLRDYIQIGSA